MFTIRGLQGTFMLVTVLNNASSIYMFGKSCMSFSHSWASGGLVPRVVRVSITLDYLCITVKEGAFLMFHTLLIGWLPLKIKKDEPF